MKRPELMITNGELAGRRFQVKEGGLRLGRSSSNDIHISDEGLSRNHCLFEAVGAEGIRLTDLASANGTYLNGKELGGDPADLKVGDVIEVGATVLHVVGDPEPKAPEAVDLGLGSSSPAASAGGRRRSPLANVLWAVAVLAVAGAIGVVLMAPPGDQSPSPVAEVEGTPTLREFHYEKVEADSEGIFRYALDLTPDGVLSVTVDDVPKENRHLTKRQPLSEQALAELGEILAWPVVHEIDREYAGVEPDPPALSSWTLRTVYSTRARTVRVVNTQEPDAFRSVRERLETFSKNQLGIWALQYSRDKLIKLAEEAVALGRSKWDDRDVQHGNLFAAVAAYRDAIGYLETVNPKPPCMEAARKGLEETSAELEKRYRDQRFLADQALNRAQWDVAQRELLTLMEMIPDRHDERNREASAKLMDVEKRMKGGK